MAVAAVASHAIYFYDGGFQDSCFDESKIGNQVPIIINKLLVILIQIQYQKKQIDQLVLCLFCLVQFGCQIDQGNLGNLC